MLGRSKIGFPLLCWGKVLMVFCLRFFFSHWLILGYFRDVFQLVLSFVAFLFFGGKNFSFVKGCCYGARILLLVLVKNFVVTVELFAVFEDALFSVVWVNDVVLTSTYGATEHKCI